MLAQKNRVPKDKDYYVMELGRVVSSSPCIRNMSLVLHLGSLEFLRFLEKGIG